MNHGRTGSRKRPFFYLWPLAAKPLETTTGTTLTGELSFDPTGTTMTGEIIMDNFILKNTHRYRALVLTVERITEKQTNPIYDQRRTLVDRIVSEAWAILREASLAYDSFREFVASGVAERVDHIDIEDHAATFNGRYVWKQNVQIWNSVLEQVSRGTLMGFAGGDHKITQPGEIVSFTRLSEFGLLPHASLRSALALQPRPDNADILLRQRRIQSLIDIDLAAMNKRIMDCYADLPAIADSFSSCHSVEDLLKIFPAARALFVGSAPPIDERAQKILASL